MRSFTIGRKILVTGLTLVIIPLVALSIVALAGTSAILSFIAENGAVSTAKSYAAALRDYYTQELRLVSAVAATSTFGRTAAAFLAGKPLPAETLGEMRTLLSGLSTNYHAVSLVSPTGDLISGVLRNDAAFGDHERALLNPGTIRQAVTEKKATAADTVLYGTGKLPVITVYAPILHNGEPAAVLCITADIKQHVTSFQAAWKERYFRITMCNSKGIVLISSQEDTITVLDVSKEEGVRETSGPVLRGETGFGSYVYRGYTILGGYAPVNVMDWRVAAGQPAAVYETAIRKVRTLLLAVSGGILLLSILIFSLVISRIVRPLRSLVNTLGASVHQVRLAASQVNSASQALASATSQQAASLEETSAALEELTGMTRQNADNALSANKLMLRADELMRLADEKMSQLVTAMEEITQASQDTKKIIKTIDEIAFQTNLLSLNAAVEAARAGDAGAGFAVVADEVRSLSQRSAEAARNTTGMIETSVQRINEGGTMMQETSIAYTEVQSTISQVKHLIAEISEASKEQAIGLDSISHAVHQMDLVVQNNAASSEETAASSNETARETDNIERDITSLDAMVNG